jgi:type IV pilus assembly protein PilW
MTVRAHRKSAGFSLIELMVAMVIGLITSIIMMQALTVSEGYRRSTTTGGDAQSTGALSMYTLQRDLRLAGFGISTDEAGGPLAMCSIGTTKVFNSGRSPTTLTFQPAIATTLTAPAFVPVAIYPATALAAGIADAGTDVIQVIYSNNLGVNGTGIPVTKIDTEWLQTPQAFTRGGLRHGDLALLVGSAGCTVVEVTALPWSGRCGDDSSGSGYSYSSRVNPGNSSSTLAASAGDNIRTIEFRDSSTGYQNFSRPDGTYPVPYCPNSDLLPTPEANKSLTTPRWNSAGLDANASGMLYPLGARPDINAARSLVVRLYAVRNQQLWTCDLLSANCLGSATVWSRISDEIVNLRAYYGLGTRTGSAYSFTSWSESTAGPITATDWGNVIAVKLAVVARSKQFERDCVTDDGTGVGCTAALQNNAPAWADDWIGAGSTGIDISTLPDWKHYRYRTFETTIPIRNVLWK